MKIAILGSKGQLGLELTALCRSRNLPAEAADLPEVDISDFLSAQSFLKKSRFSIVVNAAAYTNVDRAESDEKTAFAVNSDGPEFLARICTDLGIPLVHISTDYVFDGKGKSPYKESDPVNPLGVYGRSKEEGERRVRSALKEHLILRTAWLYSPFGHNFVRTMLRLGMEKEEIGVVADQYGSPTCAADLADVTLTIVAGIGQGKIPPWGTYHFSGQGVTSWHGFAQSVFELAGKKIPLKVRRVRPLLTEEYPTAAARPKYSVLDCFRIQSCFGIRPRPWRKSLEETLRRIVECRPG